MIAARKWLARLVLSLPTAAIAGAPAERTLAVTAGTEAAREARHALVIGNSAYPMGRLRNAVNDARAMAQALRQSGFDVTLLEDAGQSGMQRGIRAFGDKLAAGGVGLFYYAGHGVQLKGRNFLIPVGADIEREDEIEFASVEVNQVLAKMDTAKNGLNIVILDACRNNPFARGYRSMQSGLAHMDAPTGTFIAFATAPGSVAADGADDHGVYTKHLLAGMAMPGMPVEQLFKQVRNNVIHDTGGQQIPWESSSLRGEFAFVGNPVGVQTDRVEIDRLIQAALERQRSQLEAQFAASGPLANVPAVGDSWSYRLTRSVPRRTRVESRQFTVVSSTPDGIVEREIGAPRRSRSTSDSTQHGRGAYLMRQGDLSIFSPYLTAFGLATVDARNAKLDIRSQDYCDADVACTASVNVVGSENIQVPAGVLRTTRVDVQIHWIGRWHIKGNGHLKLSIWYAPDIRRAVKISSRSSDRLSEANFDLELEAYSQAGKVTLADREAFAAAR